jgi:hypothetical protein
MRVVLITANQVLVRQKRAQWMGGTEQTESEIARRLAALTRPDSVNAISAQELREWVAGYLRRHDEELARFPDEVGQPHWNFWMKDFELGDAVFAAVVFRPGGLEFFCGTGDCYAIKRFGESEFPDDPEQIPVEMRRRFTVPDASLHLGQEAAAAWLGRDGWCG